MRRKRNRWIALLFPLFFCILIASGCSSTDKKEGVFKEFETHLSQQNYEELYQLLSSEAQEHISKEDFVTRHTNIHSGIGASNIKLTKGEIDTENNIIPFSLTMETTTGEVTIDGYELPLVKENDTYKINWTESLIFPQMEAGDKVRISTEPASRGRILDRNGKVLAEDGTVNIIGIHPAVFDQDDRERKITELTGVLDISEEVIIERLDNNTNPDHFVPIVRVLPTNERLTVLQEKNLDGVLINSTTSRVYVDNPAFGRLLGFIGAITAEELANNEGMGYTKTSTIGKAGLEQVHEATLRGIDGSKIFIERNEEIVEVIAQREAQNGQDLKLSIDADLQAKIYDEMNKKEGAAAAVHPTTGEVLALVSSPSYNSNRFMTYITRTEQQMREATNFADELNRFSSLFSPGSTFKLVTATIGLVEGTIDPNEQISIPERQWQKDSSWGNYRITRVNSQPKINLKDAIKFSDNIYFAKAALELGSETFIAGARKFGIGEQMTVEFPHSTSQISNSGDIQNDILLADSGYGQGEIMVTPLDVALQYSALSNNGNIMNPTLLLNEDATPTIWKEAAIPTEFLPTLQDAFKAVVHEQGGTATAARIDGIQLAGKTGTAEIKDTQDAEDGILNGWFVATDLDEANISLAMVLKDVENGSSDVVPIVRNILAFYLK